MEVSELITSLKSGELKKLSLKTSESDVFGFINDGILDLYKRFPLHRENVSITPVAGVKDYVFDGYDTNVPLNLDESVLLLIEEVTATSPAPDNLVYTFIPSNRTKPENFSTPSYNTLRINTNYELYALDVDVRLAPQPLLKTNEDIPLPPQLLRLLRLFVGYKGSNSVSADIKGENNTYYVRYLSEVKELILSGQYPIDELEYSQLDSKGFL